MWRNSANSPRVIVCGALNVDHLCEVADLAEFRAFPWWPQHGERALSQQQKRALDHCMNSSSNILSIRESGGGQAGNVACALAGCGVEVTLISKVGDDIPSSSALAGLEDIDLSHVAKIGTTSEAFVFVDQAGNRDILLWCPEKQIPCKTIGPLPDAEFIHFTSLPTVEQVVLQAELIEQVPSTVRCSLDIGSLYAEMGHERLAPLLRRLHVLFATESELEVFASSKVAARALLFQAGLEAICEKSGPSGATLVRREGVLHCEAPAVEATDSTGAGDVLAATFIASVINGAAYEEALKISVPLASASVRYWGRTGYPSMADFRRAIGEALSHDAT